MVLFTLKWIPLGAPAELSERTLREFFLKSWQAFAKAGGKGAMVSYGFPLQLFTPQVICCSCCSDFNSK